MESTGPCLVDEVKLAPRCAQLPHHPIHRPQIAADLSEVSHVAFGTSLRDHHVDRFLVDIETHYRATFRHGPASLHVALCSTAGFPTRREHNPRLQEAAPLHSAHSHTV